MPSGYMKGGKPDSGWWMEQVEAGIEFRKKYAHEDKWDTWRRYYRGQWRSDVLPVNIFFSFLRSTVPRVYFRNPTVSVTPAKPGFLEMAFAQVTHRVDNRLIKEMGLKKEAKMMVQEAFMFGTCIGKLGYGGRYSPSVGGIGSGDIPIDREGEQRVEYDSRANSGMPWFARTSPGQFIVPDMCRSTRDARWVAHWLQRPREDVAHDPRLDKENRQDLPATKVAEASSIVTPVEMVDLVEIRDAKTQQVILIAPYGRDSQGVGSGGSILYHGPDRIQELTNDFGFQTAVFNPDDEVFWGIPDSMILEPHQLEINEIRTQVMKHRRLALVKILARRGLISAEDQQKMLSEDVAAVVEIDGQLLGNLDKMQVANIPQDLIMAGREVIQDVKETFGFSRNQMGDYQSRRGDTSAAEAEIVAESSELRTDERREELADLIVRMVEQMNPLLFDKWSGEQVESIVGPGGAEIWVKFDPANLNLGHYTVKVDPDSAKSRSRSQREQKAMAVYTLLKENPLVDPMNLTRYVLTEIEGVEMDDIMNALPMGNEGATQGPMGIPQLAGLLSAQTGAAQRGVKQPGPGTPAALRR